ncbi:MAG: YicC family protein [Ignavibacteria bacterium]|nr:YicC family protein [Ignavibacteria bacterium]
MIVSMTGYGKAEGIFNNRKYMIEIRSLNNRFFETSFKLPRYISKRELEIKEIIREKIFRGKIYLSLNAESAEDDKILLKIDKDSLQQHLSLLKSLRKKLGTKEKIKINHILHFSEIFDVEPSEEISEEEFEFICGVLREALDDVLQMKRKEGGYIETDILQRIDFVDSENNQIKEIFKLNSDKIRSQLIEKVNKITADKQIINENRLEIELILIAERLDITEECLRLKSHLDYFRENVKSSAYSGRRLNFLLQEMNREANTIAAKSMDAVISQKVSVIKEELEKIREQLQNIE